MSAPTDASLAQKPVQIEGNNGAVSQAPQATVDEELKPIAWPTLPSTSTTYPSSLDEFMDQYGQRLVPSRADNEAARSVGREHIWNFFFQIQPEDVLFIQREEEKNLKWCRERSDYLYGERVYRINWWLQYIHNRRQSLANTTNDPELGQLSVEELEAMVKAASFRWRPHGQIILGGVVGLALAMTVINASQVPFNINYVLSVFITWAFFFGVIGGFGFAMINQFRAPKQRTALAQIKARQNKLDRANQDEPRLKNALAKFEAEYRQQCDLIDQRFQAIHQALAPIIAQLPKPPSGQEVIRQLQQDLVNRREHYIDRLGLRTRLENISRHEDDEEIRVPNPLPFISPGQLQDQSRIPLPYQLPQRGSLTEQIGVLGQRLRNNSERRELLEKARDLTNKLVGTIKSTKNDAPSENIFEAPPLSDRARHLLARQLTTDENTSYLLHGVYYIEYLFIAKSMLVHHGFFYDFILDRTIADRTTELFLQDIVAIEKSLEYRLLPKRFDNEETILIEDAPMISITLPSGDQRSFTFATHAYLNAIKGEFSQNQLRSNANMQNIELDPVREARLNADEALRFLSGLLRQHKYLHE
jgi:hypothetical protein